MPGSFKPRGRGGYANRSDIAKTAIAIHICRGCGLWHERAKPAACLSCGRMDFDDFQSKGEAQRWAALLLRQRGGLIAELERQVKIDLLTVNHQTGKPVVWGYYLADFRYRDVETGERVTEEYKPGGSMSYDAALKLRCVEAMGIKITVVTK